MDGGGLRAVLEGIHRGELAITSERIIYIAMRIGHANDRFVIPTKHPIQEAHRAGVGDEGADIGFINERNHESQYAWYPNELKAHEKIGGRALARPGRAEVRPLRHR